MANPVKVTGLDSEGYMLWLRVIGGVKYFWMRDEHDGTVLTRHAAEGFVKEINQRNLYQDAEDRIHPSITECK